LPAWKCSELNSRFVPFADIRTDRAIATMADCRCGPELPVRAFDRHQCALAAFVHTPSTPGCWPEARAAGDATVIALIESSSGCLPASLRGPGLSNSGIGATLAVGQAICKAFVRL
jgi:hypothetical protein